MDFYWIYNLPQWLLALLISGLFVGFSLLGLMVLRKFIVRNIIPQAHNDIVSYFMSGTMAVYGITVGLTAVGTWEIFSQTEQTVANEAAALAALYRDVGYSRPRSTTA
jgi:hypothetical protein